jgi:hypothetical protein
VDAIEVGKLLGDCASHDRRKVGATDVVAWLRSLGDLSLAECQQAVAAHYAESTDWIMAGHIRARVLADRRDRLARAVPSFTHEVDDNPALYLASLRAQRAAIASGQRAVAAAIAAGEPLGIEAGQ